MIAPTTKASTLCTTASSERSLRDLFVALPLLPATLGGGIDYQAADPQILVRIATGAEFAMQNLHRGVAAMCLLIAQAARQSDAGETSSTHAVAIGMLVAGLCEVMALAQELAAACRLHADDYRS